MRRTTNPKDIPPSGEYDLIVMKAGQTTTGAFLIHARIEGGEHHGHRVSGYAPEGLREGHRLTARVDAVYTSVLTGETVDADYREANVKVSYRLSDFKRRASAARHATPADPRARFRRA